MSGKRIYSGTQKERRQQASKKYRQSEKGKATIKRSEKSKRIKEYRQSEAYKRSQREYQRSEKGVAIAKKYRQSEKGKIAKRKRGLKQDYGLTLAEYNQMFKEQNGVCIVCKGINTNGQRLVVDHNHKTGKIRGLLCHRCNLWLGVFENGRELFKEFEKYLNFNSGVVSPT